MRQFKTHYFFQPALLFFNIIPMASESADVNSPAVPIDSSWILLVAGIILGICKIYKYEKAKKPIPVSS